MHISLYYAGSFTLSLLQSITKDKLQFWLYFSNAFCSKMYITLDYKMESGWCKGYQIWLRLSDLGIKFECPGLRWIAIKFECPGLGYWSEACIMFECSGLTCYQIYMSSVWSWPIGIKFGCHCLRSIIISMPWSKAPEACEVCDSLSLIFHFFEHFMFCCFLLRKPAWCYINNTSITVCLKPREVICFACRLVYVITSKPLNFVMFGDCFK